MTLYYKLLYRCRYMHILLMIIFESLTQNQNLSTYCVELLTPFQESDAMLYAPSTNDIRESKVSCKK